MTQRAGLGRSTGSLAIAREQHTATLLPNGKVLVAGGSDLINYLASAELYDPASGTWTTTGSLATARLGHTATLLPNGKMLVAGGAFNARELASAELYDPASGPGRPPAASPPNEIFTQRPCCPTARCSSQAVAGLTSTELYDPASGTWTVTGRLADRASAATATLLPDGNVLVAGGIDPYLASAELYDVGLGFRSAWQPGITGTRAEQSLQLTGAQFQGVSQASGGNTQDSSSNYPIVQLRSIDNSQVAFLLVDPVHGWSDTSFRSTPVPNFPIGPALVTVFTNGIPSTAKYLVVPQPHGWSLRMPGHFRDPRFSARSMKRRPRSTWVVRSIRRSSRQ